jgi:hypothetical protein
MDEWMIIVIWIAQQFILNDEIINFKYCYSYYVNINSFLDPNIFYNSWTFFENLRDFENIEGLNITMTLHMLRNLSSSLYNEATIWEKSVLLFNMLRILNTICLVARNKLKCKI